MHYFYEIVMVTDDTTIFGVNDFNTVDTQKTIFYWHLETW